MRRAGREPAAGAPQVVRKPGMADELLRELAPLLAEEGIDLDGGEIPDLVTLQAAMDRAVQRHNMQLFTPVGEARDNAAVVMREAVIAIGAGDGARSGELLDAVEPEPTEPGQASVAGCTGVAVGLLDSWLGGQEVAAPAGLGERSTLPAGHWLGERAATDIIVLAGRGRAFQSLQKVIARQGGYHVLFGSALAVAAVLLRWSQLTGVAVPQLAREHIR
ncbi:hypothetical protein ACWKSP_38630 [Micromonosporaceae bacterium Da 78-11]